MADARPPINRLCVFAWRWESGLMHYECGILKDEATPDGVEYWAIIPELDEVNTVAPPAKKMDCLRS